MPIKWLVYRFDNERFGFAKKARTMGGAVVQGLEH
jgi:hypothetical protein